MGKQLGKLIFGLTLLIVGAIGGAGIMLGTSDAEALDRLIADAGPDQTVYMPGPVMVQFDGSGSYYEGGIRSYKWYSEWGTLKAEGAQPAYEVFTEKHKPGMTRKFKLVVTASNGDKAHDWVTITLAEQPADPGSLDYDPAAGSTFTGSIVRYGGAREEDQDLDQTVVAGKIKGRDGEERWYVASIGNSQTFPMVRCHQGTHWVVFDYNDDDPIPTHGREGCVGDSMIVHHLEISRRWPLPEETPQQWVIETDAGPLATLTREKGQQFGGGGVAIVFDQSR